MNDLEANTRGNMPYDQWRRQHAEQNQHTDPPLDTIGKLSIALVVVGIVVGAMVGGGWGALIGYGSVVAFMSLSKLS